MKKSESDESPYSAPSSRHAKTSTEPSSAKQSRGGRPRKRGGRKKSATNAATKSAATRSHHRDLTSHPTTRNAQVATRAWLLKHYGPHCAYCGVEFHSRVMTLDHVAPRRGQIAYDRRDNLVLACRPCNALKRDQSPLAFLLAVRSRAANLLKYGAHLSAGLLDLARPLIRLPERPPESSAAEGPPGRIRWGASDDDGPSPYRDG